LARCSRFPKDTSDPVVSRNVFRGTAELAFGYRALFFPYSFPTYGTLSLGGAASIDRGTQRSLDITYAQPGCPRRVQLRAAAHRPRGGHPWWWRRPMASLHVTFSAFDLGYAYKLDVMHPVCLHAARLRRGGSSEVGSSRHERSRRHDPHPRRPSSSSTTSATFAARLSLVLEGEATMSWGAETAEEGLAILANPAIRWTLPSST